MIDAEMPNIMQVRAFVRVAELGSVSRATEVLFRAQSVVTRAIAELETRFAVPLFERHANGMRLTGYGECLLPRAQRVLAELDSVQEVLGVTQGEPLYLFQARRLQVFVKLCETRHMQTVARHFGLSQPAVSAALKVLEGGCGQPLFVRTSRGLQPTTASRDILFPIRRSLNELRHMDSDLSAMQGTLRGVVHVGALPLGRSSILPDAILRFTALHPQIRVVTNESPFDLLATELRVGDSDFILGALRPQDYATDLVGEPLISEQMVLLARQGHPLSNTHLTLENVHQAHWVLPRAGSPARRLLDSCFAAAGLSAPWPVVESGDLAIIRGLLVRSDMLAAVSAHQLGYEIASGELQRLPLALPGTTRAIGLMQRAGCLQSPAASALMACIRQVISEPVDAG
ncbi:LysR family transcriptional regulator [Pseudomonas sp. PS1(2021)]|uniref:LysR family transcriptional regulator n=1 Tax=Pseudomonas sp. PS1(2021) TaxID=2866282 RepID=UPI001CF0884A|nr:LysR family transcriptional regulator [Pseudomonas sp. PS1(2021)]UCM29516.1 LysR family transcriptional regulator [Pseudomonas sp. PS1(2021)]